MSWQLQPRQLQLAAMDSCEDGNATSALSAHLQLTCNERTSIVGMPWDLDLGSQRRASRGDAVMQDAVQVDNGATGFRLMAGFSAKFSRLPHLAHQVEWCQRQQQQPPNELISAMPYKELLSPAQYTSARHQHPAMESKQLAPNYAVATLLDPESQYQLDPDKVQLGRRMAVGGLAEVFEGMYEGMPVAVKRLLTHIDAASCERAVREIQLLCSLRHPNLLLFMGYCAVPEPVLVSEYMAQGSLFNIMRQRGAQGLGLEPHFQQAVAVAVACGMAYLHARAPPILHLDLKSPNILVDENWRIKVADFGLSAVRQHTYVSIQQGCGTAGWVAPEILRSEPYAAPADVYSFGVVLWEICSTPYTVPWDGLSAMQVVGQVGFMSRSLEFPPPGSSPDSFLVQLCGACMARDPGARPSFQQIMGALNAHYGTSTWCINITAGSGMDATAPAAAAATEQAQCGPSECKNAVEVDSPLHSQLQHQHLQHRALSSPAEQQHRVVAAAAAAAQGTEQLTNVASMGTAADCDDRPFVLVATAAQTPAMDHTYQGALVRPSVSTAAVASPADDATFSVQGTMRASPHAAEIEATAQGGDTVTSMAASAVAMDAAADIETAIWPAPAVAELHQSSMLSMQAGIPGVAWLPAPPKGAQRSSSSFSGPVGRPSHSILGMTDVESGDDKLHAPHAPVSDLDRLVELDANIIGALASSWTSMGKRSVPQVDTRGGRTVTAGISPSDGCSSPFSRFGRHAASCTSLPSGNDGRTIEGVSVLDTLRNEPAAITGQHMRTASPAQLPLPYTNMEPAGQHPAAALPLFARRRRTRSLTLDSTDLPASCAFKLDEKGIRIACPRTPHPPLQPVAPVTKNNIKTPAVGGHPAQQHSSIRRQDWCLAQQAAQQHPTDSHAAVSVNADPSMLHMKAAVHQTHTAQHQHSTASMSPTARLRVQALSQGRTRSLSQTAVGRSDTDRTLCPQGVVKVSSPTHLRAHSPSSGGRGVGPCKARCAHGIPHRCASLGSSSKAPLVLQQLAAASTAPLAAASSGNGAVVSNADKAVGVAAPGRHHMQGDTISGGRRQLGVGVLRRCAPHHQRSASAEECVGGGGPASPATLTAALRPWDSGTLPATASTRAASTLARSDGRRKLQPADDTSRIVRGGSSRANHNSSDGRKCSRDEHLNGRHSPKKPSGNGRGGVAAWVVPSPFHLAANYLFRGLLRGGSGGGEGQQPQQSSQHQPSEAGSGPTLTDCALPATTSKLEASAVAARQQRGLARAHHGSMISGGIIPHVRHRGGEAVPGLTEDEWNTSPATPDAQTPSPFADLAVQPFTFSPPSAASSGSKRPSGGGKASRSAESFDGQGRGVSLLVGEADPCTVHSTPAIPIPMPLLGPGMVEGQTGPLQVTALEDIIDPASPDVADLNSEGIAHLHACVHSKKYRAGRFRVTTFTATVPTSSALLQQPHEQNVEFFLPSMFAPCTAGDPHSKYAEGGCCEGGNTAAPSACMLVRPFSSLPTAVDRSPASDDSFSTDPMCATFMIHSGHHRVSRASAHMYHAMSEGGIPPAHAYADAVRVGVHMSPMGAPYAATAGAVQASAAASHGGYSAAAGAATIATAEETVGKGNVDSVPDGLTSDGGASDVELNSRMPPCATKMYRKGRFFVSTTQQAQQPSQADLQSTGAQPLPEHAALYGTEVNFAPTEDVNMSATQTASPSCHSPKQPSHVQKPLLHTACPPGPDVLPLRTFIRPAAANSHLGHTCDAGILSNAIRVQHAPGHPPCPQVGLSQPHLAAHNANSSFCCQLTHMSSNPLSLGSPSRTSHGGTSAGSMQRPHGLLHSSLLQSFRGRDSLKSDSFRSRDELPDSEFNSCLPSGVVTPHCTWNTPSHTPSSCTQSYVSRSGSHGLLADAGGSSDGGAAYNYPGNRTLSHWPAHAGTDSRRSYGVTHALAEDGVDTIAPGGSSGHIHGHGGTGHNGVCSEGTAVGGLLQQAVQVLQGQRCWRSGRFSVREEAFEVRSASRTSAPGSPQQQPAPNCYLQQHQQQVVQQLTGPHIHSHSGQPQHAPRGGSRLQLLQPSESSIVHGLHSSQPTSPSPSPVNRTHQQHSRVCPQLAVCGGGNGGGGSKHVPGSHFAHDHAMQSQACIASQDQHTGSATAGGGHLRGSLGGVSPAHAPPGAIARQQRASCGGVEMEAGGKGCWGVKPPLVATSSRKGRFTVSECPAPKLGSSRLSSPGHVDCMPSTAGPAAGNPPPWRPLTITTAKSPHHAQFDAGTSSDRAPPDTPIACRSTAGNGAQQSEPQQPSLHALLNPMEMEMRLASSMPSPPGGAALSPSLPKASPEAACSLQSSFAEHWDEPGCKVVENAAVDVSGMGAPCGHLLGPAVAPSCTFAAAVGTGTGASAGTHAAADAPVLHDISSNLLEAPVRVLPTAPAVAADTCATASPSSAGMATVAATAAAHFNGHLQPAGVSCSQWLLPPPSCELRSHPLVMDPSSTVSSPTVAGGHTFGPFTPDFRLQMQPPVQLQPMLQPQLLGPARHCNPVAQGGAVVHLNNSLNNSLSQPTCTPTVSGSGGPSHAISQPAPLAAAISISTVLRGLTCHSTDGEGGCDDQNNVDADRAVSCRHAQSLDFFGALRSVTSGSYPHSIVPERKHAVGSSRLSGAAQSQGVAGSTGHLPTAPAGWNPSETDEKQANCFWPPSTAATGSQSVPGGVSHVQPSAAAAAALAAAGASTSAVYDEDSEEQQRLYSSAPCIISTCFTRGRFTVVEESRPASAIAAAIAAARRSSHAGAGGRGAHVDDAAA